MRILGIYFQTVYPWRWIGIGRDKPSPYYPGEKFHGSVYKWRLRLGFFEILKRDKLLYEQGR